MPSLAFETQQLELADRHIHEAEARITHMRATLQQEQQQGFDTEMAERALQASLNGLDAFHQHRVLILRNIEDIRAGRLPST